MSNHVTAVSRDAGRNIVHTVTDWYGEPAINGTRRSAHSYSYAICRRIPANRVAGIVRVGPQVIVDRWSRNSKCASAQFAVAVVREAS